MRHSFHHVAIAGDEVHVVIEDFLVAVEDRGHVCLSHCHANGVTDSLSERTSRRLDSRSVAVLGMSRRLAFPLPELLQVLERQLITGEIEDAVQ